MITILGLHSHIQLSFSRRPDEAVFTTNSPRNLSTCGQQSVSHQRFEGFEMVAVFRQEEVHGQITLSTWPVNSYGATRYFRYSISLYIHIPTFFLYYNS